MLEVDAAIILGRNFTVYTTCALTAGTLSRTIPRPFSSRPLGATQEPDAEVCIASCLSYCTAAAFVGTDFVTATTNVTRQAYGCWSSQDGKRGGGEQEATAAVVK